jgi:adenylate cyclase
LERRLAAILAADVVGYSRLMGADEGGTLERLKTLRRDLVQPKITERGGRIVKLMGDGLLAEFPSVVEAVQCAVDVQEAMEGRDAELADDRRIVLRIGVNLGDVMVEGSDIYGDGVNVAARLEALAEPGGLCLSGAAFDMVEGKLDAAFEDMGERRMKNIAKPVRVYHLTPSGVQASGTDRLTGALPLPDKPSIAILPFTNMSGDSEQDYFSDGITEDIITELSRFSSLFVIARNSSFAYKGQAVDVRRVAEELGVRFVLEGSIRRAAERVRITAQLIDSETGSHIWAERYDRELNDLFDLQEDITRNRLRPRPQGQGRSLRRDQRDQPGDGRAGHRGRRRGAGGRPEKRRGPLGPGLRLSHAVHLGFELGPGGAERPGLESGSTPLRDRRDEPLRLHDQRCHLLGPGRIRPGHRAHAPGL